MVAISATETEAKGTVVVIGPNYWGSGDTVAAAKRRFTAEGGRLARGYVVLTFSPDSEFKGVDGMGYVHWDGPAPAEEHVAPRGSR